MVRPRYEIATPVLLLLGPIFHLLRSHEYPLLRAEVLLVASAVVLVGLVVGLVIHRGGLAVRSWALALLLAVVVDLYVAGGSLRMAWVTVASLGIAAWLLRTHISTIAFAISVPLLLSTVLPATRTVAASERTWSVPPTDADLPLIFHFILDEHAGLAGLAQDTALVGEMSDWYAEHGFMLFPNAFSPYFDTYNALPNLVNFTAEPTDGYYLHPAGEGQPALRENRYFEAMHARGYSIRVHQTDYIDFCDTNTAPVASCITYPANSLAHAAGLTLSTPAHARLVATYVLANRSWLFERVVTAYRRHVAPALSAIGLPAPAGDWLGNRVSPPIEDMLGRIQRDASRARRGELHFAHILMPHYPYQYDSQCSVRERVRDRLDRVSPTAPPGMDNTPESRERRFELYAAQVRCLMRRMDAFVSELDSLGVGSSAIVILQGDHGSRIGLRRPQGSEAVEQLTRQDVLDAYSTLFAVRAPGVPAGSDTATVAIGELLSGLVASDFSSTESGAGKKREAVVFAVTAPRGLMIPVDYRTGARVSPRR